ncbi:hypothetical protein B0H13DRAFT_2322797 [Mycena leptocephala]|nr:hypothetical protein B0H13DRAFT_2322797 [Mycena leptocephala]
MANLNAPAPAATPVAVGASVTLTAVHSTLQNLVLSLDTLRVATASLASSPVSELFTVLNGITIASDAVAAAAADVEAAVALATAASSPAVPAPTPTAPAVPGLRTSGPWLAGLLYAVTPLAPLTAVADNGDKWFAITRGRYVGLTKNSAISHNAVTGISSGLSDKCGSQAEALEYFNGALGVGAVVVTQT